MRWDRQRVGGGNEQALPGLAGLIRTVQSPEFAGVTFHEVRARSVLNKVGPSSGVPFRWTVNPYRGCSHACKYCFARSTHNYLDFDSGRDFDTQVVVKVNAAEVLASQLRKPSWAREHVAMGTNTDPYQRAEGRYGLMPGIIRALARSGTPFSILTKGTVLSRDLPLLREVNADVPVGLGVSIALLDRDLQRKLEPGTPSPQARLDLVRRIRDAGLPCGVFVAPVLPGLTDSTEALGALFAEVVAAGATGVTVLPLHLRPGAREWYGRWLAAEYPALVPRYRRLYAGGSYAGVAYRRWLSERVSRLLRQHGLEHGGGDTGRVRGDAQRESSEVVPVQVARGPVPTLQGEQLPLL
ncbi:DNA repair photolyase [Amycolatopsis marina]|uniref:DNA repair photolyase n=1 Tax=Amycolatopsis marina TaxID=490629 RepID=A0A1I0ZDG9_9PSEU|nr:Rv2578c family radical SAM protein [Amycolatopsis marina]SFB22468.1 DNA repair photolyase [Amycolatopsis marina]